MNYYNNGIDCPYRGICDNFLKDGSCSSMCVEFHEINRLFKEAEIPLKYSQPFLLYPSPQDLDNYKYLNEIKKNIYACVCNGDNYFITSRIRLNGKTSWGIKLLQNYLHSLIGLSGERKRGLYISVEDYLAYTKSSFDQQQDKTIVQNLKNLQNKIDTFSLVVWDDIGERRLTEWERNILKQHIKKRLSNGLSNVFIGSSYNEDLILKIGEDLKFYIQDNSNMIILKDKRGDYYDRSASN